MYYCTSTRQVIDSQLTKAATIPMTNESSYQSSPWI